METKQVINPCCGTYVAIGDEHLTMLCLRRDLKALLPMMKCDAVLRDSSEVSLYPHFGQTSFIMADVEMADGDSITAVHRYAPHVPVFFFGGYEQEHYDFDGVNLCGYLLKPLDIEDLRLTLSEMFDVQLNSDKNKQHQTVNI